LRDAFLFAKMRNIPNGLKGYKGCRLSTSRFTSVSRATRTIHRHTKGIRRDSSHRPQQDAQSSPAPPEQPARLTGPVRLLEMPASSEAGDRGRQCAPLRCTIMGVYPAKTFSSPASSAISRSAGTRRASTRLDHGGMIWIWRSTWRCSCARQSTPYGSDALCSAAEPYWGPRGRCLLVVGVSCAWVLRRIFGIALTTSTWPARSRRGQAESVTLARRARCPHGIRPAPPRSGWAGYRPRRSGIPLCRPGRRPRS